MHEQLSVALRAPGAPGAENIRKVIVCAGTACRANGAMKVYEAFVLEIKKAGFEVVESFKETLSKKDLSNTYRASKSGCQGFCQMGPLVTVEPEGILYVRVKAEDVPEIVEQTLVKQKLVDRLLYVDPATRVKCPKQDEIPFYKRQTRSVLKLCGEIDPESIEEYFAHGGYESAKRVLTTMTPEQVCQEMLASGLRGRGGGGFPTGRKWDLTRVQPGPLKYLICNGDEGDPGAFMDRSVMEGNPHSVIEGMTIGAYAIGASEGIIYVRAEYPLAVENMRKAVACAQEAGMLGKNLFGTEFHFNCRVVEGAGAFVCGEETALMASVEGCRGMPRPKPPFPAQSGLWGKPTAINNVETLASVPLIFKMGPGEFRKIGVANSAGTKTFALTGHVANTGLIEVPFGTTLREIIFDIGGGVTDAKGRIMKDGFKAVQIGGPSGGCLTAEHLDLPLEYESLKKVGAMIGSGGLVVMNRDTCMVSVARYFMQFTQNESCGKCVLCREGTKQMLSLLDDITEGRATMETLDLMKELAEVVQKGSLCGLGKTAPSPVLSTMRYFREEYERHVLDKWCPTGECKALARPEIVAAKCRGCGMCLKACPVSAITGEKKQAHTINAALCIKCGACAQTCKFNAVVGVS
jgi:NADH-quinone oxidoreductase subunit F